MGIPETPFIWVLFVSDQAVFMVFMAVFMAVFMSRWEFVSGRVWAELVAGQSLSLDMSRRCLFPVCVYSMNGRKWISEIILFPSSSLFHAEAF